MSEPERIELDLPAHPDSLDLVHAELEALWERHPDVGDLDRMRFETGVIEILGNIVEHSFRIDLSGSEPPEPAAAAAGGDGVVRRLDIALGVADDGLTAVFGDNGLPAAVDLSQVTMPGEDAESGRGLALALAALDDLAYERVDGRNQWNLLCVRREG